MADRRLEKGAISDGAAHIKLREKVVRPVKTTFSLGVERSSAFKTYKTIINRLIYTPVSTYGVFLVTLGIYMGLVYFVNRIAYGMESANVYRLLNGCVLVALSLPLLLVQKPLVRFLGDSAVARAILGDCIDLDSYREPKRSGAVGSALIIGSLSGVLSFFCGEEKILLLLAVAVYGLLVIYSPEFGLFGSALVFPFVSKRLFIALVGLTVLSYTIKVLRGKRNFKLSASNVFLLFLAICYLVSNIKGGGVGAGFAFSVVAFCILAANLCLTERLLRKIINTVVLGLGIVLVIFCYQMFNGSLEGGSISDFVLNAVSVFGGRDNFLEYFILVLPYLFCKAAKSSLPGSIACFLTATALLGYCVYAGRLSFAILTAATVALYLIISTRQIFIPLIACFGVPVGGMYFAAIPITFGTMGLYDMVSAWVATLDVCGAHPLLGVGMSGRSLQLAGLGDSRSMYFQTLAEGGALGFILLVLALFFTCQRLFATLPPAGSDGRRIGAATGASVLMGLIIAMGNNLWVEPGACAVLWLSLGLASAAYEVRKEDNRGMDDGKGL